jgi:hypothetical protein
MQEQKQRSGQALRGSGHSRSGASKHCVCAGILPARESAQKARDAKVQHRVQAATVVAAATNALQSSRSIMLRRNSGLNSRSISRTSTASMPVFARVHTTFTQNTITPGCARTVMTSQRCARVGTSLSICVRVRAMQDTSQGHCICTPTCSHAHKWHACCRTRLPSGSCFAASFMGDANMLCVSRIMPPVVLASRSYKSLHNPSSKPFRLPDLPRLP